MSVSNKQVESIKTGTAAGGVIFFDGVCGLCNKFVQHVLAGDPEGHFQFASLQSELAREVLGRHGHNAASLKSVYLVKNYGTPAEKLYCKSEAALRVMAELNGWTSRLKFFLLMPTPMRDTCYDLVAAIRYKVFGKYDSCPLPDPRQRNRFLDL